VLPAQTQGKTPIFCESFGRFHDYQADVEKGKGKKDEEESL